MKATRSAVINIRCPETIATCQCHRRTRIILRANGKKADLMKMALVFLHSTSVFEGCQKCLGAFCVNGNEPSACPSFISMERALA